MDREINDPAPKIKTDAEFAADAAATALSQGRYELGRALANLATIAYRAEVTATPRMVPMRGATRDEHPSEPATYANGPSGNGDLAAAAQTEIFGAQEHTQAIAQTARCATEIGQGSYVEPCRRPVYWQIGDIGDNDHPARIAGWYHVDPALDQDHMPTVYDTPGAH